MSTPLSTTPLTKSYKTVNGKQMAYHEAGTGDADGVPARQSDLVVPVAQRDSPCGGDGPVHRSRPHRQGDSRQARRPRTGLVPVRRAPRVSRWTARSTRPRASGVTLVLHDWGSALGFDWANRHRDRVAGIAYMEAIVRPVSVGRLARQRPAIFQGLRSPAGEDMVIEKNVFVEADPPRSILRDLTPGGDSTSTAGRSRSPADRRPTLTWPRRDPHRRRAARRRRHRRGVRRVAPHPDVPKLFVNAEPGAILIGPQREFAGTWPNQTEVTVAGIHFIQEDSPHEIGAALAGWLPTG